MKKIFFLFVYILCCYSAYAQISIINGSTLVATYDSTYKVVIKGNYFPGDGQTHEVVDLGLSVKWATCNVGAETPYDEGEYFAWGEAARDDEYSLDTYKYGSGSEFSKYNSTDYITVLDCEEDAATVNWGNNYRMPTSTEFQELIDKCSWTWDATNNGYLVKASNGNSIFLPAAGYRKANRLSYKDTDGYYWSSTLYANLRSYAYCLSFYDEGHSLDTHIFRYYGLPIRPVAEP